ncbi:MAG: quinoprotein glucose dehydrogenase, partial [Rhodothermales bacterium]
SEPVCGMIEMADNKNPTLRHAGVMGLAGAATAAELHKLCKHPSESVRVAAVQALRRTGGHRQLISFLTDESAQVVADTVRAIYDEATPTSVAATPQTLPAVAALLAPNRSLAINVRAIAANRRIASIDAARRIANILDLPDVDDRVRIEALYALESWTEGSALDPVDGRYFPVSAGDPSALKAVVGMPIWRLTQETNPAVSERAIALLKRIPPSPEELERVTALTLDRQRPNGIRIGWLQWLRAQAPEQFEAAAIRLLADPLPALRTAAAGALGDARLGTDALDAYVIRSLETSRDVPERQQAISIIPRLQNGTRILSDLLDSLIAGSLAPEIQLDVIAAATFVAKDHPGISGKLKHYHSMLEKSDPLSRYGAALSGGDIARGKNVFHTNALAQCSKCHALNLADKQVGPSLEGIGQRKERAYLLQSIVDPQAVIVPGYGFIVITLTDGSTVSGTLLSEAKTDITVQLPNGETTTIKQSTIRSSTEPVGTMPDLTSVLTPHQIRDLVAYLESL